MDSRKVEGKEKEKSQGLGGRRPFWFPSRHELSLVTHRVCTVRVRTRATGNQSRHQPSVRIGGEAGRRETMLSALKKLLVGSLGRWAGCEGLLQWRSPP